MLFGGKIWFNKSSRGFGGFCILCWNNLQHRELDPADQLATILYHFSRQTAQNRPW